MAKFKTVTIRPMTVGPPRVINNWYPAKLYRLCVLLAASTGMLLCVPHTFAQSGLSATLAWSPSTTPGIAGYRLYYGGASRTYTNHVEAGSATNATVTGLIAGVTYYFAATDYNTNGLESPFSSEVSYVPGAASPPSVALTAPANGTAYTAPATVSLAASVVTNGHAISKVQFYNGATLLGEDAAPPYTWVWTNVAAGSYTLTGKVVYDTGSTVSSTGISISVNSQPLSTLTFASTSGTIASPFIASNGIVYQPVETTVTNGGRAAYTVAIPSTGNYLVSALVLAPDSGANSFYVNFDSEPTDPTMIWDVPLGSSFVSNVVSWRGTGTDTNDQFSPKVFSLSQGTHQLIIRGREANTQLGAITIAPLSNTTPPLIVLTSPSSGSSYQAPANISLAATVTPNGHTITKVQLFSGSTLLVEDTAAPYGFNWTNVPAGNYTLTATAVYDSGATVSSAPVVISVTAPAPAPVFSTTFASTSGSISSPFTSTNGVVFQSIETGVTNGGRAVYNFTVPATGDYLVYANVSAANTGQNSLYVNMDAEPTDPLMIWDVPVTSGFSNQPVSWRGNGTPDVDQFTPKVFNLTQGAHQLIIRGREAYTLLGAITITPAANLPSPWQVLDIGSVGVTGSTTVTGGVYNVSGAGTLGGSSDSFRFLYQPMTGDGEIRARLNSDQNTSTNARAGLMIRETLTPGSRYCFIGTSPDGTVRAQTRTTTSGSTASTSSGTLMFPNVWIRLVRSMNTFNSYSSTDGSNWTQITSVANFMATNIYFGFGVSSGQAGTPSTAVFSSSTVVP